VTARIPLSGDPTTGTVTGSGPIAYTKAEYHDEQDGTFHGQGTFVGSDTTDLTAAHGGTARVLGLAISGGSVTLDFAPGSFSSSGDGPPSEAYHNVQSYDACPGADNTDEQALMLNVFRNQYERLGLGLRLKPTRPPGKRLAARQRRRAGDARRHGSPERAARQQLRGSLRDRPGALTPALRS
jgi:hypothetical protein